MSWQSEPARPSVDAYQTRTLDADGNEVGFGNVSCGGLTIREEIAVRVFARIVSDPMSAGACPDGNVGGVACDAAEILCNEFERRGWR